MDDEKELEKTEKNLGLVVKHMACEFLIRMILALMLWDCAQMLVSRQRGFRN